MIRKTNYMMLILLLAVTLFVLPERVSAASGDPAAGVVSTNFGKTECPGRTPLRGGCDGFPEQRELCDIAVKIR